MVDKGRTHVERVKKQKGKHNDVWKRIPERLLVGHPEWQAITMKSHVQSELGRATQAYEREVDITAFS